MGCRSRRRRLAGRDRAEVHLTRNTFHLESEKALDARGRDVKPVCAAVNAEAARAAFDELAEQRGSRSAAIIRLWRNAWAEFVPFPGCDIEIRKVGRSTSAIESLNARYGGRPGPALSSRLSRPRSSAYTWSPGPRDPTGTGRSRRAAW